jgi:hypothetical protein
MTNDQIHEAMGQMLVDCRLREENGDYTPISARRMLNNLGFSTDEANTVITALHEGGFNYCLDPMFTCKSYPDFKEEPTPDFACYWGPDQLASRISWVAPAKYRDLAR